MSLILRVALAVTLLVAACADDGATGLNARVGGVVLRLPHDSLFYGRMVRAIAVAAGDSAAVEHPRFTWSSSDASVAVVDTLGNVLGVGLGTATITAELGARRDVFALRVVAQEAGGDVTFSEGSYSYGSSASCAIAAGNGTLYCRKARSNADTVPQYLAMENQPGMPLTAAHTSENAQCALAPDGQIYCWGTNNHWFLGHNQTGPIAGARVRTDLRFSSMALGGHTTLCAVRIDDSVLYCWGHNDLFQAGREPAVGSDSIPKPVTGALRAIAVSVANFQACALDLTGAPYCWGGGSDAGTRFGTGTGWARTPQRVLGDWTFASISVGERHQCALTPAGEAYCWGQNGEGQLGLGTLTDPVEIGPQRVAPTLRFSSVSALGLTGATCGITTDGDLYCWGAFPPFTISARLGDRRAVPQHIARGVEFRALSARSGELCGVTVAGGILCW